MNRSAVAVGLGVGGAVLGSTRILGGQRARPKPLPTTSSTGTAACVATKPKGIITRTEAGQKMAWRFRAGVNDEAAKFKPKTPMWVIYRDHSPGNRAVTAVSFPGVEPKPVYVNGTGERVRLRTGPMIDGKCQGIPEGTPAAADVTVAAG